MMNSLYLAEQHSEMVGAKGELARAFLRAREALIEINQCNQLSNALEEYLSELAKWGMGDIEDRPSPEAFGLNPAIPIPAVPSVPR